MYSLRAEEVFRSLIINNKNLPFDKIFLLTYDFISDN
jgi:hypothetical protein